MIDPQRINANLKTIFTMISFISKRKESALKEQTKANEKNEGTQSRNIERQIQYINEVKRLSDQNLKKIYRKI